MPMIQPIEKTANAERSRVPVEVQEFAIAKGVDGYLDAVIDLACRAFPSSTMYVSLGEDAEDETHKYIALDIDTTGLDSEALLAGQRMWSAGVRQVCPSRHAVYFVLGWR